MIVLGRLLAHLLGLDADPPPPPPPVAPPPLVLPTPLAEREHVDRTLRDAEARLATLQALAGLDGPHMRGDRSSRHDAH